MYVCMYIYIVSVFCQLGIAGAAYAVVISQYMASLILLRYVYMYISVVYEEEDTCMLYAVFISQYLAYLSLLQYIYISAPSSCL